MPRKCCAVIITLLSLMMLCAPQLSAANGPVVAFGPGTISTLAGDGNQSFLGDGGPAISAEFNLPHSVAVDSAKNVYIADMENNRIRVVCNTATGFFCGGQNVGSVYTVAGNGDANTNGDGGPAISAAVQQPDSVAVDSAGNLFFTDNNRWIRRVDAKTGVITTVAGSSYDGTLGNNGDGGPARQAGMNARGVAVDALGNLFIADGPNNRIRVVCEVSSGPFCNGKTVGYIYTAAGNGPPCAVGGQCNGLTQNYGGDNGPATSASLFWPTGVALDAAGNLYIGDNWNYRIRVVCATTDGPFCAGAIVGNIYTVAGNGVSGNGVDASLFEGGLATNAELSSPGNIAVDTAGNLYIPDSNSIGRIWKVNASGVITTVAGGIGSWNVCSGATNALGDGCPATSGYLEYPIGIAVDAAGNLYITDLSKSDVRKVNVTDAPALVFSTTYVGQTSATQTVFLENHGDQPLFFNAIEWTNAVEDASVTTCLSSTSVAPGKSCVLGIQFAPQVTGSSITGSVVLNDNAANSPQSIALSGSAVVAPINGNCGTANGQSFIAAPNADLCSAGGASSVTGSGPWNWSCGGLNGGGTASCSAQYTSSPVDGKCGAANGQTFASAPTNNLCLTGAPTTLSGDGPWGWSCGGLNNGASSSCFAGLQPPCDSSHPCPIITTVAGAGPNNLPALASPLRGPYAVAADAQGNTYVANGDNRVFKVDTNGILTVFAGNGEWGNSGDEGPAVNAEFNNPWALAVDSQGSVYIADTSNSNIRKVTPDGIIHHVAGMGMNGWNGDGLAKTAWLSTPESIAFDAQGNLFIADTGNNLIREITPNGMLHTVAGNNQGGQGGFGGDGGPATSAQLNSPSGVAVDTNGNVFVTDSYNHRIRMFTVGGNISTVAGNPGLNQNGYYQGAYGGDGGPATAAQFDGPRGILIDANNNIFVADTWNDLVRVFTVGGNIQTVAGFQGPWGLAFDNAGNLLIAECQNNLVRRITGGNLSGGNVSTVAGNLTEYFGGEGVSALIASLTANANVHSMSDAPRVALDNNSNLFIADSATNSIRKVDAATGQITTFAGQSSNPWGMGYGGDGGPAANAYLRSPQGMAFDSQGNLFFADNGNHVIRKIDTAGYISTVAGNNLCGYADNLDATQGQLCNPAAVAIDTSNNLYIADSHNCVIRKIAPADNQGLRAITTVVGQYSVGTCYAWPYLNGNGPNNLTGDNGAATSATLGVPQGVALDKQGNLFIADTFNNVIRRVDAQTQIITTIAGTGALKTGPSGEAAISTQISWPIDLTVDDFGNIYFAELGGAYVRQVRASDSTVQTIAGTGTAGFSGDGGPAVYATLDNPTGVALDLAGNLYIYDGDVGRVRKVNISAQQQTTPRISVTPDPLNFGNTLLSTPTQSFVTVTNAGGGTLQITSVDWDDISQFSIIPGGTCGGSVPISLNSGQSCTIEIAFTPTSLGVQSTTFRVYNSTADSPHSSTFTGIGVASLGQVLNISPVLLDFGSKTVGTTTAAQTITLMNQGGTTWTANTIGPGANTIDDFTVTGGSCITSGSVLVPGASCTVDVTFSPWLAGPRSGTISITDNSANSPYTVGLNGAGLLPDGVLTALPTGISPMRIAVNSNTNKMYVPSSGSNFITVIDGATNTSTTVDVGSSANRAAVNPVTNKIYFALSDNHVAIVDGANNAATRLDIGGIPWDVAVDSSRNKIYVPVDASAVLNASPAYYLAVIDGDSKTVINKIALDAYVFNPFYAAVNPNTNKIYLTHQGTTVLVIDGATGDVTPVHAPCGHYCYWMAVNPVTDKIYIGSSGVQNITVLDGPTNGTTLVATGTEPESLAVNTVTNRIYVANYSDNTVTVIDGNDNSTQTVNVGASPFYIAVNEVTNRVYVSNSEDNHITVVDGVTNATSSLPADRPWPVAVNPVTNTVYVGNRRAASGAMNGSVFVIQGGAGPETLTVSANAQTMTYGGAVPALTYTVTPTIPLDTPPTCVSTTTSSSLVGTYPTSITCSGASKAGYSVSYVYGGMTVTKASLTITFNDATKVYGQTLTFKDTEFTTTGLVNGDTVNGVAITSTGAAATAPVSGSPYAITFSSGAWGSLGLANYQFTYVPGTLTVQKAPLTITAMSWIKTYGDVVTFAGTEFTTSGLLNSDSVSNATLTSASTAATAPVGPYSIVPSNAAGTGIGNYNITYVNGIMTVTRKPLAVTANSLSKVYGQTDPTYTASYNGFVNGDTASVVGGAPVFTVNGTSGTMRPAGSYTITPSYGTLTATNYNFTTFNTGTLTVTQAALRVTATNVSKTYGQADPAYTVSYSGFVNGENSSLVGGAPAFAVSGTSGTGRPVGSYTVTPSIGTLIVSSNYSFTTFSTGSLTVNPANLTITASSWVKTYGDAVTLAGIEFTTSGLLNSDSVSNLTLTSAATAATAAAGSYGIVPSSAIGTGLGNYAITYVNGTFTVAKKSLTVTANSVSKSYGQADPTYTVSYNGFVNGDTASVVGGTPVFTVNGTSGTTRPAGSYTITPSYGTLTATNYNFTTFNAGTLTVNLTPWTPPSPASVAIAYLDPVVTQVGTSAFTLHVNGVGFTAGAVMQWNGSPRTTSFADASNLTATITGADIAQSATIAVTVKNPDGTTSYPFSLVVDPATSGAQAGVVAESVELDVAQGQPVATTLTLPGNVVSVRVTVNCLNLPQYASCSYNPSTRKLSISTSPNTPKGKYQIVVVVTYSVQAATLSHARLLFALLGPGIGLPFGLLWMGGRRGKRLHWGVLVLLALMMIFSLAGCGGHADQVSTQPTQSSLALTLTIS